MKVADIVERTGDLDSRLVKVMLLRDDEQIPHLFSNTDEQPLGKAIVFIAYSIRAAIHNVEGFNLTYRDNVFKLDLPVSDIWHILRFIDDDIQSFRAKGNRTSMNICSYGSDKEVLSFGGLLVDKVMMTPALGILILNTMFEYRPFADAMISFCVHANKEGFEKLHKMFLSYNKDVDLTPRYQDVLTEDKPRMHPIIVNGNLRMHAPQQDASRLYEEYMEDDIIAKTWPHKFESDAFPESFRSLIPSLGKEFELDRIFQPMCDGIVSGRLRFMLLHGPAGSGKTMACKMMCQRIGIPLMATVSCTDNLDEFILGKYIPVNGRIEFVESFVTKAIREGGAVVFEEINFARPQYLAFLNSLLDDNGMVRLDNGEVVRRHENFRFFATMNPNYSGTRELNHALFNRFNAVVEVKDIPERSIRNMLLTRVPDCEGKLGLVLDTYRKVKNLIDKGRYDAVISPRNLENWANMAMFMGWKDAFEVTILPIARNNRAFEQALRGIINLNGWR